MQIEVPETADLQLLPPPLVCERLKKRGLTDFDEFDPAGEVETPRSVAACLMEGIRPRDLSYVPPEAFEQPGVPAEVAPLRFDYFEALRQDLLALARAAYSNILAGEPPIRSFGRGVGLEYPCTHEFFRNNFHAVDLQHIPVKADWTSAPRTQEFKPMDMYSGARASSSQASPSSAFLQSPVSKNIESGKSWHQLSGSDWRSSTSTDALHSKLHHVKTAPGSDWREVEAARRVEDTFGILREMKLKARDDRHSRDNRLIEKRNKGLQASFERLHFEQSHRDRLREIREHMMPPVDPTYSEMHERAKNNRLQVMNEQENFRREFFVAHASKTQAMEKRIEEERNMQAMKYALLNTEDRVRWRHNHAAVVKTRTAERQGVLDNFSRRQAQLDVAGKRAEECGAVKKELLQLRDAHRKLFDYRSERKDKYDEEVRSKQIKELAEKRVDASIRTAPGGRHSSSISSSVASSPSSATAAPPMPKGLLDVEEDPREEYSPAERQWMQRALRGTSTGCSLRSLAGSPLGCDPKTLSSSSSEPSLRVA